MGRYPQGRVGPAVPHLPHLGPPLGPPGALSQLGREPPAAILAYRLGCPGRWSLPASIAGRGIGLLRQGPGGPLLVSAVMASTSVL